MKIGVLTHHWLGNFGANLQAFATAHALESWGHEAWMLNYRAPGLAQRYKLAISEAQAAVHQAFVDEYLRETRQVQTLSEFEEVLEEGAFDCLLTGSDAVFRLAPASPREDWTFPNPFWLVTEQGIPRVRRVAFAPSAMGYRFRALPRRTRRSVREAIESMDEVSVRDIWTSRQLRSCGVRRRLEKVPDPVFLLRDWIRERVNEDRGRSRPYIVISLPATSVDDRVRRWVAKLTALAETSGVDVVSVPIPDGDADLPTTDAVRLPLHPNSWVDVIANSSGYIGVRFHPIVVSLAASVPVVSLDLYHCSWRDAAMSKTVDILSEVDGRRYVIGRGRHHRINAEALWRLLEEQRLMTPSRDERVEGLAIRARVFLQRAMAA